MFYSTIEEYQAASLRRRALWCVDTGRVANRELRRMPKVSAMAWAFALAKFRGNWDQAFRGYMLQCVKRDEEKSR